jgi:ABC-type Fe3+ transport system substrate-binding protein
MCKYVRLRTVVLLTLAIAAAASAGCKKKADADLIVLSPHNDKIQTEFARAFSDWHQGRHGSPVKLEWRDVGGSTECTKYLLNTYSQADTSGIDLYFGGGMPDHARLAEKGCLAAVELPAETLAALPQTLSGINQYDQQRRWYGAALSSFGIIYNAQLLKQKNIPPPQRWEDLAGPVFYGWIEAANGTQSGSARAAYEMIIQSAPDWPAGWAKLLKIFGNCKNFPAGASEIPTAVAQGDVLAGAVIDFYAYDKIAQVGDSVGFTVVAGTTAFTPDPIAMLKNPPHGEMAGRFIEFVLSPAGQALWCLPPGSPDGPKVHALYRQPVRKDVYEKYRGKMLKPLVDPFAYAGQFKMDQAAAAVRISQLLGPLMQAAAISSQEQLAKAWKVVLDAQAAGSGAESGAGTGAADELLKEFTALPENLKDNAAALATAKSLGDEKLRPGIVEGWQTYWRNKYNGIIARKK